jgi:DNA-directed RNA polymerase subunit alpha
VEQRAQDLARDLARALREKRRYPVTGDDLYAYLFMRDLVTREKEFMADFTRVSQAVTETDKQATKESYTPIEILNLSPRTLNSLINAGVGSIEQLVKCTPATLSNFRGFGTKALDEVKQTLATRSLTLTDDQ